MATIITLQLIGIIAGILSVIIYTYHSGDDDDDAI